MGKSRSMMRKKKYDDRQTIKPWTDLTHDVLFLVIMKLGVVDFIAFSRVCKSWRSLTVSNRNKFIVSRPPMSIYIPFDQEECYLEDFEGRKLKTILPHFAGRRCIGVTCGYLILFGKKRNDVWLVNLITRHELHFPNVPGDLFRLLENGGATLVFSPSISRWVLVVFKRLYHDQIWFCVAGKQEWTYVPTPFPIHDLIAFKGKVYTAHYVDESKEVRLCEMKLYLDPELVLLSFPKRDFGNLKFFTCGENLNVIDLDSKHPEGIHGIDLDEMKWVSCEKAGEEYAFFCSSLTYDVFAILSKSWADLHSKYWRFALIDENVKDRVFHEKIWYFFHDCLNVNILHE